MVVSEQHRPAVMPERSPGQIIRPPFERETLRVGVIGTGFGAAVHVPALRQMDGVEVAAICSSRESHAQEAAARLNIPRTFLDYREMLFSGEIDAVTVAAPPHLHHPMVLTACEAELHVLCEKPFARTAAEARDMLRMAQEVGVCHGVAFQRRYEPPRFKMKQLVNQGFIGDLHSVSVIVFRATLSPGRERHFSWLMEQEKGGGVLTTIGSHYVDQLRWCFGDIHWVSGAISTAVPDRPIAGGAESRTVDADDNTAFVVRFASGAIGSVTISYTAATDVGEEIVASGSEGMLALQEPDQLVGTRHGGHIRSMLDQSEPLPTGDQRHILSFTELMKRWVEAIRTGEDLSPSFDDGVKVQEVVDAVTRSQQLSRWIDLSGKKWPV